MFHVFGELLYVVMFHPNVNMSSKKRTKGKNILKQSSPVDGVVRFFQHQELQALNPSGCRHQAFKTATSKRWNRELAINIYIVYILCIRVYIYILCNMYIMYDYTYMCVAIVRNSSLPGDMKPMGGYSCASNPLRCILDVLLRFCQHFLQGSAARLHQMLQAGCSNSLRFPGTLLRELFRTKLQPYFSASVLHQKTSAGLAPSPRGKDGYQLLSLGHRKLQNKPVIQPSPVFGFLHELTELCIGDRCLIYAVRLSQASLRTSTSRFPLFKVRHASQWKKDPSSHIGQSCTAVHLQWHLLGPWGSRKLIAAHREAPPLGKRIWCQMTWGTQ